MSKNEMAKQEIANQDDIKKEIKHLNQINKHENQYLIQHQSDIKEFNKSNSQIQIKKHKSHQEYNLALKNQIKQRQNLKSNSGKHSSARSKIKDEVESILHTISSRRLISNRQTSSKPPDPLVSAKNRKILADKQIETENAKSEIDRDINYFMRASKEKQDLKELELQECLQYLISTGELNPFEGEELTQDEKQERINQIVNKLYTEEFSSLEVTVDNQPPADSISNIESFTVFVFDFHKIY